MSRTERLKEYCDRSGMKKRVIAERELGITPRDLSFLLSQDIDSLIDRIDRLQWPPQVTADGSSS